MIFPGTFFPALYLSLSFFGNDSFSLGQPPAKGEKQGLGEGN